MKCGTLVHRGYDHPFNPLKKISNQKCINIKVVKRRQNSMDDSIDLLIHFEHDKGTTKMSIASILIINFVEIS